MSQFYAFLPLGKLTKLSYSVPQALILERAYAAYKINWTEAIYIHYINQGNESYLADFTDRMELTDNIIENLVKR